MVSRALKSAPPRALLCLCLLGLFRIHASPDRTRLHRHGITVDPKTDAEGRRLLQRGDDGFAECGLSASQRREILQEDGRTWILSRDFLDRVDGDLQSVVNCTAPGDVVRFRTVTTVRPIRPVAISWPLTFGDANERTTFTCPTDDGALFVRSGGVVFENVAFERCFPSSGRHIVEVDQCLSASSEGSVALHNVTFRRNRLEDASAVHVRSPSCRTLEMTDVAFVDNVCSHACFGRLSANNVLRGVEMHRNADAQLEGHSASLLSLPPGSATQATRCDVRNNDVTVIKAEGATLQLSASVFEENRGRTVLLLKQKTETTLTRCRFRRNASGTNSSGGALYAAFAPFTRVSDSVFEENRGKKGGAIFVDHGALDVERCQFVGNEVSGNVRNAGGAIFAIGSRLNLDASIYLDNFADKFGGAVHAEDSAVRMSGAIFEKNAARDGGGAVYLSGVGDFWMENTTFSDGDASDGGALFASKSSGRVVDCAFLGNVAQKGGALRVAFQSSLNVISSHFSHNRANQSHGGGVLAAEESIVRISKTILINNVAKQNGGAVMLDSASEMHAHKVTIKDNHGDLSGGGIHVTKHSRLVLSSSRLRGNSGDFGGALHVTESSRVSAKETFVEKSHAEKNGGGMFIDRESVAVLEHMQFRSNSANLTGAGIRCSTKARVIGSGLIVAKNRARQSGAGIFAQHNCVLRLNVSSVTDNISDTVGGGGIYLREVGDVRLDGVVFRTNRATEGAALYMQMAQAEIKASRFEKDVATKGGSIAAKNATLAIEASDFLNGSAVSAGGCIHLDRGSNAMLNQVVLTSCASRRGGGVFIKSSKLTAEQLIVYACHAHSGGGFFAERDSAVRCSACRFDENRAGSDGGAVSILAAEPRGRAYQFFRCRFHRNSALLGGAMHLLSQKANRNCEDHAANCTFVALVENAFNSNTASAGGAIFASYPKAFRYSCSAAVGKPPYSKGQFTSLQPITSPRALCGARNNTAKNFGDFVGSYARHVHPFIENNRTGSFLPWHNDTFHFLKGHKSGDALPVIRLNVTDAFGQGPAFGAWKTSVAATLSSERYFIGNINVPLDSGEADIAGIATINSPGNYTVKIEFKEEDLPELILIVNVRRCLIGESTSTDDKLCSPCSATEFNFDPESEQCQPCPENGNCTSDVIHPNPGHWHSDPCSDHIQECLTHEACDYEERQQRLVNASRDIHSCEECDAVLLGNYSDAQCRQGYKGPLCGSCEDGYGRTRTLECAECRQRQLNVLFYFLAVFLLLLVTSFVIKSNLVARAADRMTSRRRVEPSGSREERNIEMTQHSEAFPAVHIGGTVASLDSEAPQYLSLKAERTKERLVELFKISINFFQVVAVAISLNMNWTASIIHLLSTVDFLGGAATETVTLPIDCFLPSDASIPRSVLRTIIFMGIPVLVAVFFAVFWAIALYKFAKTWQYFAKRLLLSYLVIAYISYESVTKTAVDVLVCVKADVSCGGAVKPSHDYWAVDTSVECYEGAHSVLVGTLGWPVVLLFSLGFPVGLAFALVSVRRYAPERDVWYNEATGFLYRAYDDRFFFWESMIMLRKSLLAVVVAFGYTLGPNIQCVLALSVLTIARYCHTLCRPFDQAFDELNAYESASLFVSQLAFMGGLLFNDSRVTSEVHILLTVILFLAIGGLSVFFFSRILISLATYSRIALKIKGIDYAESWGSIRVVCALFSVRAKERFSV